MRFKQEKGSSISARDNSRSGDYQTIRQVDFQVTIKAGRQTIIIMHLKTVEVTALIVRKPEPWTSSNKKNSSFKSIKPKLSKIFKAPIPTRPG